MGNEAEKLKKKAQKEKNDIKLFLQLIEEREIELKKETDQKKIDKLKDKIETNKRIIKNSAETIGKSGESIADIMPELSLRQREIIMEVFPQGMDVDTLKYAKQRSKTINNFKEDIKKIIELRKEYSYSDDMPIEEKAKNKLFKKEQFLGFQLMEHSNPKVSTYQPAWNYIRDFDNTFEFTEEEREIIKKSVKNNDEWQEYLDVKYAAIRGIGKSLEKAAEAIGDWGDRTQAQVYIKKIKPLLMPIVDIQHPGVKLTEQEKDEYVKEKLITMKAFLENPGEIERVKNSRQTVIQKIKDLGYGKAGIEPSPDMIIQALILEVGIDNAMFLELIESSEEWNFLKDFSIEELGLN